MIRRLVLSYDPLATPSFGFSYACNLPSDFVTLSQLQDSLGNPLDTWSIEGGHILSDETEIRIIYYTNEYQAERIPAYMVELMAAYLAYQISFKLNPEERPRLFEGYLSTKQEARRAEARNSPPQWYAK